MVNYFDLILVVKILAKFFRVQPFQSKIARNNNF